jgi:hypothetical protein
MVWIGDGSRLRYPFDFISASMPALAAVSPNRATGPSAQLAKCKGKQSEWKVHVGKEERSREDNLTLNKCRTEALVVACQATVLIKRICGKR